MSEETSNTDRLIMRYIGEKTPREIAELTGLKSEEILARKAELLDSIDVLTIHQQRQKLMIELREITGEAKDRAREADPKYAAGLYNTAINAMDKTLKIVAGLEKNAVGEIESLNIKRKLEILRLFDVVVNISVEEIASEHELDRDELLAYFTKNLVVAAKEIEAQ